MYDIIIFEGLDRCFKTTTKKNIEKLTNFKYICIDRMYLTAIVYEKLKNRNNNLHKYYNDFTKLIKNFNVLIIYLKNSDCNEISRRVRDEKEDILKDIEVQKAYNIFEEEIKYFKDNFKELIIIEKDLINLEYDDAMFVAVQIVKENNLWA